MPVALINELRWLAWIDCTPEMYMAVTLFSALVLNEMTRLSVFVVVNSLCFNQEYTS
jgi:hypothetical protein